MTGGTRAGRALAVACPLLTVVLVVGATAASAFQFYDGVGNPPPAYPTPGKAVAISSGSWGAQSFQASASYVLTAAAVWANFSGSPPQPVLVEVRADAGGQPDMGRAPLASATVFSGSAYGWVNATFSAPVQLVLADTYWVVLRNATGASSAGWSWWNTRSDTFVVPGTGMVSTNGGSSWSTGGLGDFDVRTYGYQETDLRVAVATSRTDVPAGQALLFTLWLNNSGTEVAQQASVGVDLPPGLSFVADNATSIGGSKGSGVIWSFSNVPAGSRWFLMTVEVNGTDATGSLLTAQVTLTYTDFLGNLRPPSMASVTLTVLAGSPLPPPATAPAGDWLLPLTILAVLIAAAVGATVLEWRRRADIDEVFLAHDSGVLLVHFSKTVREEKDRDILVGMLTAVQSFIKDSFSRALSRDMRQLDFGDREILIEKGSHCYLAVVVHGRIRVGLRRRMRCALAEVEAAYRGAIEDWDGGMESFSGAEDVLLAALLRTWAVGLVRSLRARVGRAWGTRPQRRDRHGGSREGDFVATRMDLEETASLLIRLPELQRFRPRYRGMLSTVLVEAQEGRLSLADLADVYTIAEKMKGTVPPSVASWWDLFLRLVHGILVTWSWDLVTQAWVRNPAVGPERLSAAPETLLAEVRIGPGERP